MTPEQRAEARQRLLDLAKCLEIHPALLQPDAIPDAKLQKLLFEVPPDIRSVLDALEAAERERDTARARLAEVASGLGEQMAAHGTVYTNIAVTLRAERDTARAQVETLAEALRWYGDPENWIFPFAADLEPGDSYEKPAHLDRGDRARAALTAAGVEKE